MIRIYSQKGAAGAKAYYTKGLSREDYYTQEVVGKWHGKAASALGLRGEVTAKEFGKLVDNINPATGSQLTPRNDVGRIVGWDINFHAPKSLSIVHALNGDERLLDAFRQSVRETMADIETQVMTRVRSHGQYADRATSNFVWGEFVHLTARPVEGVSDAHMHVHAWTANCTYDDVEKRWKAAKMRDVYREMPYHRAAFHARLAGRVALLGYEVKRTRHGWEIAGVSRELIEKFSQRTAVVENEAKALGISDPKEKEKLGALTREKKSHKMTPEELLADWWGRLTLGEKQALAEIDKRIGEQPNPPTAKEALDHAMEKLFAKDAVVRRSRILMEALRYGVGTLLPEAVIREYQSRGFVERSYGTEVLCTDIDVLAEEIALVKFVREGKGTRSALVGGKHEFKREFLSDEQRAAAEHVFGSNDLVIAIRGGAGVGKTTVMQETVEAIQNSGTQLFAFAPSAEASRQTLREAGFENAQTVAHLLTNEKLQRQVRGKVVWIDEAGLLGTREMWQLVQSCGYGTRFILTGDQKQHASVSRGNPFSVMQRFGGLVAAEITEIRRQKPQIYKQAVGALAKGDLKAAFAKLEAMDAIREIEDDEQRYRLLAADYVRLAQGRNVPLVVSPTHGEGAKVTQAIRTALAEAKRLGKREREFVRFDDLRLEEAELQLPESYAPGMMVQYHQNAPGIVRGQRFVVSGVGDDGKVRVKADDKELILDLSEAKRFKLFRPRPISLAKGERIRITQNGFSKDGKRHNNGNERVVASFTRGGDIKLTTGAVISKEDGHFSYGYCRTSHASQSRSVKDVLIAQSSESLVASSREQFYVSVSRGKERIQLYTDDWRDLQQAVGVSTARKAGLELVDERELDEIMAKALKGDDWRSVLGKKREGEKQLFTRKLQTERKQPNLIRPKDNRWQRYVEMRRRISTRGGRGRVKMPGGRSAKVNFQTVIENSKKVRTHQPGRVKTTVEAPKREPLKRGHPAIDRQKQADKLERLREKNSKRLGIARPAVKPKTKQEPKKPAESMQAAKARDADVKQANQQRTERKKRIEKAAPVASKQKQKPVVIPPPAPRK